VVEQQLAERVERRRNLGELLERAERRQLLEELAVFLRLRRILVLQLGDQQLQERVAAQTVGVQGLRGARACASCRLTGTTGRVDYAHPLSPCGARMRAANRRPASSSIIRCSA